MCGLSSVFSTKNENSYVTKLVMASIPYFNPCMSLSVFLSQSFQVFLNIIIPKTILDLLRNLKDQLMCFT